MALKYFDAHCTTEFLNFAVNVGRYRYPTKTYLELHWIILWQKNDLVTTVPNYLVSEPLHKTSCAATGADPAEWPRRKKRAKPSVRTELTFCGMLRCTL